jgi:transposase
MSKLDPGRRIVGDERMELAENFAQLYAAGDSIRAIADASGRSYGFVHRVLNENGVTLRARGGDTKRRNSD